MEPQVGRKGGDKVGDHRKGDRQPPFNHPVVDAVDGQHDVTVCVECWPNHSLEYEPACTHLGVSHFNLCSGELAKSGGGWAHVCGPRQQPDQAAEE